MEKKRKFLREWYRNLKLAKKMMIMYVMMLGVCFLLCLAALQYSFNIYDGKLYEKSLQELDFFTQQVNQSLDEVEDLSYYVAIDTKIQEQLTEIKTLKHFTAEYTTETYKLRMLLNNELMNTRVISNILYTDGENTRILAGINTGTIGETLLQSFMERMHEARGAYVLQQPTREYPYLLSGRDIRKHTDASLEYLGSLLITSDVAGMIEKNIGELEAESSALCVYSDEGVIYENREHMMDRIGPVPDGQGYQIIKDQGQRYFVCYLVSAKTGWTYVNMFPYSEIYGQNQNLRCLMFGGFFLLFLFSVLIAQKLAHVVTKPLEQLTKSMEIVETGDFMGAKQFLGNDTGKDEIGRLTQEFEAMVEKINHLIHENYEKQLLLKDTKYKMLQAQINPHFLYNTLNSINWMIRAGRNDEAAEMTVALGIILRSALSKEQYFTLQEEMENLKKYITIQKYRYQRRAEFLVEENVAGSYLVPHMTLQPLVENAIYHGVEKMLTVCTISVAVWEEEDKIRMQVKDNGPGMSEEELKQVRAFKAASKGHGIGLKNISERLRMAFGQAAEFDIESVPHQGTAVTIKIPKVKAEENHG